MWGRSEARGGEKDQVEENGGRGGEMWGKGKVRGRRGAGEEERKEEGRKEWRKKVVVARGTGSVGEE